MSWLFGLLADRIPSARRQQLRQIHPEALHCVDKATLYLAAGGLPETCLTGPLPDQGEHDGWLMVGIGMLAGKTSARFAASSDVTRLLSREHDELDELDGHYVVVEWSPANLRIRCDTLGLRTLYVSEQDDGLYLSTRLDWLARAVGGLSIDFASFGSHWLGANQYSHRSLVHGVKRLPPGGVMTCSYRGTAVTSAPWTPTATSDAPLDGSDLARALAPYLRPELPDGRSLSLALSGGLDSRALLAILLHNDTPFGVHIFGDEAHPDAKIASRIAQDERLTVQRVRTSLPPADRMISELEESSAATHSIAPASATSKLGAYRALRDKGFVCIDGFFGEIARRQYFKRLATRRGSGFSRNGEELLPLFQIRRPAFFNAETQAAMRAGMVRDLEDIRSWYSSATFASIEDFLDLLAIRFRLPNFSGYEQARLDGQAVTYMPFVQRPFLNTVLHVSLRERRGGEAFKRMISNHRPSLTNHPLVKGATTYPYAMGALPARLWTILKARLGFTYTDRVRILFLTSIEEYVRDAVRSASARSFGAYDHDEVYHGVESFYAGNQTFADFVDWWISFETWRTSLAG